MEENGGKWKKWKKQIENERKREDDEDDDADDTTWTRNMMPVPACPQTTAQWDWTPDRRGAV